MKLTHNITITVFVKPDEDSKLTAKTILEFLPKDLDIPKQPFLASNAKKLFDKEKITIEEILLKSEHGDNLTKFYVKLTKERHTKVLISKLKEILGKEQTIRLRNEENRIDESGMFYLRLERESLEKNDEAKLTDRGSCFHFKIMLACFPKTRNKAIEVSKELWDK